jgi:hypothetical protein
MKNGINKLWGNTDLLVQPASSSHPLPQECQDQRLSRKHWHSDEKSIAREKSPDFVYVQWLFQTVLSSQMIQNCHKKFWPKAQKEGWIIVIQPSFFCTRGLSSKRGVDDGNKKWGNSLQSAKENSHFYIKKIKACKEFNELTGSLKGIRIINRRGIDVRNVTREKLIICSTSILAIILKLISCSTYKVPQSKMKPIAPTLILSEKNIVITQDEYTSALCAQ